MQNLVQASQELFRRTPDECFPTLDALSDFCQRQKEDSRELWQPPNSLGILPADTSRLLLSTGDEEAYAMNDWSFGQLCRLAGVAKDTVNRLVPATAARVFQETLPRANKPMQLFTEDGRLRSIHGASYTRLFNADLLDVVQEYATDFRPPQEGMDSKTGLYAGQQDMFAFLIDPEGWTEIEGEAFAPGFFCWNSETGARTVGIQTFWFQKVCKNHIVWDAVEVVEITRKHTANVHDSLDEIRRAIEVLVQKRDARRDGFATVIAKAMKTKLGDDADEVEKVLGQNGISRGLVKQAMEIAQRQGAFTIFSLVDALTRLSGQMPYVGGRTEIDQKAAGLLALAV
jgi:hypothetical protein